jgi:hypothetical protein
MHSPVLWRRLAPALACAASLLVPAVASGSTGANVRVVAPNGETLADQHQYTDTVRIKTDPQADCFGPGSGGSGRAVRAPGATALGIVKDASAFDRDLRPISVTDAFDFGLGICGFGGHEADQSGFWYLKHNHAASQVGGDQLELKGGDEVLWYLDSNFNDPPPAELALRAPVRSEPGAPFQVRVFEYADDGTRRPAEGAKVTGASQPTDQDGRTEVVLDDPGTRSLEATRSGDIPSKALEVCVNADASACPTRRGERIFGSQGRDRIDGTRGDDLVKAGGGADELDLGAGGEDAVNCGGGRDRVLLDKGDGDDRIARNCERVARE